MSTTDNKMPLTAEQTIDRLRQTLVNSSAFDNFECNYGPTLGTCPESNNCIECEAYRTIAEFDGGKIDMNKVKFGWRRWLQCEPGK